MTTEKKQRGPRIGPKVRKAIEMLASGRSKNLTQAASDISMSREHLSRELKKPHVAAFYESITRQLLSAGMIRAGARLIELVDAGSEHVSLDASTRVLAIGNVRPPDQPSVMINMMNLAPGYVIDMRDPRAGAVNDEAGRARLAERGLIEGRALPALPTLPALPPARAASGFHIDAQGDVSDGDRRVVSRIIKPTGN